MDPGGIDNGKSRSAPPTPHRVGRCFQCGYSLVGLARQGICPECGDGYSPGTVLPVVEPPEPMSVCVVFGWPFVPLTAGVAILIAGEVTGFWLALLALAVMPVNAALQLEMLSDNVAHLGWRYRPINLRLRLFGRLVTVLLIVVTTTPLVIFGGCVLGALYLPG